MILKNVADQFVIVYAYNSTTGLPVTGDSANITAYISKDVGASVQTNDVSPTELDAVNQQGMYYFALTQAESNCNLLTLSAKSTTTDVCIEPVIVYTGTDVITEARLARLDANVSSRSSHSADDVWLVSARTLSSFGSLVSDIATAVWGAGTKTLTGFGTLVSDIWANTTRTITDKTGFALTITPPTAVQIRQEMDSNSTKLDVAVGTRLADNDYTAPDNASITSIASDVSRIPTNPATEENVSLRLTTTGYTAPDNATIGTINTLLSGLPENISSVSDLNVLQSTLTGVIELVKAVTDKLDTTMQIDGGVYQFTANALELAPVGESAIIPTVEDIVAGMDTNSTRLASIVPETRLTSLMYDRTNTFSGSRLVSSTIGGDIVVNFSHDELGRPLNEVIV